MASVLYDPEKVLILGIAGHARSGKDTAARFISEFFKNVYNEKFIDKEDIGVLLSGGLNLEIFRFADPIKNAAAEFMKYFFDMKESGGLHMPANRYFDMNEILKQLDEYKNNGELIHGIDIRKTQQQLGSVMRNQNKDIFVEIMIERIKKALPDPDYGKTDIGDFVADFGLYGKHIVIIPDTRFANEESLMRETFGDCYKLILVDRPEITEKAARREPPYDHESEQQISLLNPDVTIQNDKDLDDLKTNTINQIMKILVFQGWVNG